MARRKRRPPAPPTELGGAALRQALALRFPGGLPEAPPPPPPPPPPPRVVTESELMAAAFAALASGDAIDFAAIEVRTRRSAPERAPPRPSPPPERPLERPPAPCPPKQVPEDSPPSAPGLVAALQGRAWAGAGWRDDPNAPFPDPDAAQRSLLARARRGELPTLKIRGLRREPALAAVASFVALHRAAGRRYVRVVTGKGLGSPGEPVLKEALAAWCASSAGEAHVQAWAPEREAGGEFGAVILQLRPR